MNAKFSLTLVAAALLAACGGSAPAPAPQQKPAAKPAVPAVQPPAAASVADGDFGVKECDDYIRNYLACVDSKVPEAARAMVRQSLDQAKAQWKAAAATPQGKASLATGCKAASDAARQSMAAYGCQW